MLGYITLLLWVAILAVAVGAYDVTLVKVRAPDSACYLVCICACVHLLASVIAHPMPGHPRCCAVPHLTYEGCCK
jgi:hypothetical protein